MIGELERIREEVAGLAAGFEPGEYHPCDAARIVELAAQVEKLVSGVRLLATSRAANAESLRSGGSPPAQSLARLTGRSEGEARRDMRTARQLERLSGTADAVRAGRLSPDQASHVAAGASADPDRETDLLEAAETTSLRELGRESQRIRSAADTESQRYERIRRTRHHRRWFDEDGAYCYSGKTTPECGARIDAAIEAHLEPDRVGAPPRHAREVDALVAALAAPSDDGRAPRRVVNVIVDATALDRGSVAAGERCEIDGVGPIPVAIARGMATDAAVNLLAVDGVDVTKVVHLGDGIPAHLRTALIVRDPECVVPGCAVRHPLEIDHTTPRAKQGPTSLENLGRLCREHHHLKTFKGYQLWRDGDQWCWRPPDRATGPPTPRSGRDPLYESACDQQLFDDTG